MIRENHARDVESTYREDTYVDLFLRADAERLNVVLHNLHGVHRSRTRETVEIMTAPHPPRARHGPAASGRGYYYYCYC